jgi:hypothetical protein
MKRKTAFRAVTATLLFIGGFFFLPEKQRPVRLAPLEAAESRDVTQRIYAPLPNGIWLDGELVLNNNGADAVTVRPTLFSAGTAAAGAAMTLQPAEVRWLRLSDVNAPTGRELTATEAIELEYLGQQLEVGAQVTLLRRPNDGTVDVPFSMRGEYQSAVQEAVWPSPAGARAVVVLGNTTSNVLTVTVTEGARAGEKFEMGPHETRTIIREPDRVGLQAGAAIRADSMRIEVAGPVGSVRAIGFVETRGKFSGAIRFYDPATARQPNLFATNLRLGHAWPALVLKNTSDSFVTATPRFLPFDDATGQPVELTPVMLTPKSATMVDLAPVMAAAEERSDLERVSVEVVNSGPPGSLIGGLSAFGRDLEQVFDVPLREPGSVRQSTGSYPWRIDGDYNTVVSVTNVAATRATFVVKITYADGSIQPAPQHLAPGETAMFDMRRLRDGQSAGAGRLPATVTTGQFRWSIIQSRGETKLNGRAEIVSVAEGRTSSYSCPECCPWSHAGAWVSPTTVTVPVGGTGDAGVTEGFRDCYYNFMGTYPAYAGWWDVVTPSVTSVTTVDWGLARADGLAEGLTDATGVWDADYWDWDWDVEVCVYSTIPAYAQGAVNVQCAVPTNLQKTGASDIGGGALRVWYAWSSSTGSLSALQACNVGERVTYPQIPFPTPFPALSPPNPTEIDVPGSYGGLIDTHSTPGQFRTPYFTNAFHAEQIYRYQCPCSNGGAWSTMMGPHNITRFVNQHAPNGNWYFLLSKLGDTATIDPLP